MQSAMPDNALQRMLFSMIGNDRVIWSDQDMEALIEDKHNVNADLFSVIDFITNGFNKIDLVIKRGAKEDAEIIKKGELYDLIQTPNPSQSQDEFFALGLKFKLVTGNWMIWGPRRFDKGPIIELWNLPSQYTKILSGGWAKPVKGFTLEVISGRSIPLNVEEVLHIREPNLSYNGQGEELYGMSRLKPGSYPVDINNSAQTAQKARFDNRGAAGFLTVLGADSAKEGLKASQDIKNQVRRQAKGSENEGALVATGYDVKFTPTTVSAVDLGVFEGQRRTLHQLCNLYHIPPILFDPTVANTYNNIREAQKDAYRNAVIPEVQQFCTDFNRWIGDSYKGEWIDFDTSGIECLQSDQQAMAAWLNTAWWMTPNQKLAAQGLPLSDDPEMDKVYIPSSLIPLVDEPIPEALKSIRDYR